MGDKAREAWRAALTAWNTAGWKRTGKHHEAGSAVIATALDEARAEERRAIVEWLRSGAGNFAACGFGPDVAEAIERGDHIKAQEKQE